MKEILYLKIYKEIVDKIHNGTLVYGDKLPSKRKMAKIHNVSIITVENAYNQLVSEGYVYSKEKSGFYVNVLEIEKKSVSIPEEELAEIIDISTRQLQRIENGESITKIKTLKKVINVLKIEDKDIILMIKS